MDLYSLLLALSCLLAVIAAIFFVVFGQVTVRKLRKNRVTKDALGMEFVGGWDIFNVASALALPQKISRRFKKSPLSVLHADADLLNKYTTKFDKILAKTFYSLWIISGLAMITLMLLDITGIF